MLRTLWKFRLLVILAALVLVAGGAIAVAAKEGTFSSPHQTASAGESQQGNEGGQHNQQGQEPTQPTEPTATPRPPEPTQVPIIHYSGTITAVDCEKGTITVALDNNGGSMTFNLTSNTVYNVSGCSALQVNAHAELEVQGGNVTGIHQDDTSSGGGGGGTEATPTPGANH